MPDFESRSRRRCRMWIGRSTDGRHFEFDLEVAAGSEADDVLKQGHVILFEPNLAEVIGDFKMQSIIVASAHTQGSEPKVIGVPAEHGAEVLLGGSPNRFSGGLHLGMEV